jgi:rhamnogalacturonyl hydrolase YesR
MNQQVVLILSFISVLTCLHVGCLADDTVIFAMNPQKPDLSKFKLTFEDKWHSVNDGIVYRNNEWGWATATIDPGVNDYQIDAEVSIEKCEDDSDLTSPGKYNGPGIVFRKSGDRYAVFYLSQALGGWSAHAKYFPPASSKFPGKDTVFALSKDTEMGKHRLRVLVKGNLANCFVDDELACILDLSDLPDGEVGLSGYFGAKFTSFVVSKLPEDVQLQKSRPVRQLLPGGKIYKAKHSWKTAVQNSLKIMDTAIERGTSDVPGQEHMPHFTYRCVTWMGPGHKPFYAYPAHHQLTFTALLNAHDYTKNKKYMDVAIQLANWLMENSTPADSKLPHLPFSTTYNGEMGGGVDGDTIMIDKAGLTGQVYLKVWRINGDRRFKDAAIRLAETLLSVQQPAGQWQGRVEYKTGKVVQDYVANQIVNIMFMDDMYEATGDERYKKSSQKALDWMLNNPVKTWRWTGYYEDVAPGEESIGNWEAIELARYLIDRREKNPEYMSIAKQITDWVVTSFAVNQDGKWPLLCEQSVCMPPMVSHTFNLGLLLSAMYRATGEQYYRDAAVSAANAAFDLAVEGKGAMDWYSIAFSPLRLGLKLVEELGL